MAVAAIGLAEIARLAQLTCGCPAAGGGAFLLRRRPTAGGGGERLELVSVHETRSDALDAIERLLAGRREQAPADRQPMPSLLLELPDARQEEQIPQCHRVEYGLFGPALAPAGELGDDVPPQAQGAAAGSPEPAALDDREREALQQAILLVVDGIWEAGRALGVDEQPGGIVGRVLPAAFAEGYDERFLRRLHACAVSVAQKLAQVPVPEPLPSCVAEELMLDAILRQAHELLTPGAPDGRLGLDDLFWDDDFYDLYELAEPAGAVEDWFRPFYGAQPLNPYAAHRPKVAVRAWSAWR